MRGAGRKPVLAVALALALAGVACSPGSDSIGSTGGGSGDGGSAAAGDGGSASEGGGSSQGGGPSQGGGSSGDGGGGDGGAGPGSTTTSTSAGGGGPCPAGVTCVESLPFSGAGDTASEGATALASYACAPDTDEGGPELVYRVWAPTDGFLSAVVRDGDGVDIDVHVLTDFDPAAPSGAGCVARGDVQAAADVPAGTAWIVADTWVNGTGTPLPGAFTVDIGFVGASEGPCAMQAGAIDRIGDEAPLTMPATGPVVVAGHLVTAAEPAPYPQSSTDELAEHHALSQAATGLVMLREAAWAPAEGGTFHGSGLGDPGDLPVVDEGWYVTMAWAPADRPPPGARMILRRPDDPSRAVVVAAGYETGPASLANVAGASEETLFYLGTTSGAELTLGVATDQALPVGPRRCTD